MIYSKVGDQLSSEFETEDMFSEIELSPPPGPASVTPRLTC